MPARYLTLFFALLLGACFSPTSAPAQQYFSLDPIALPAATRIVRVSSNSELNTALNNADPGDRIVLANGAYNGLNLVGLKGTASAPIVFVAENPRQAVISGTTNGRNARLSDCAHLEFYSIRFTGASVWGFTMGPAYSTDTGTKGCHNIRVVDCEVDHAGQALMKVNGHSSNIEIIGNRLHHSGMSGGNQPYAEGIYVGDGNLKSDRSHDVLIQGNHIHNIGNASAWGEAIDLKVQIYNITIEDNLIEHVTVNSQGAITVLINDDSYPSVQTDPNITISRNVIHDVRRRNGGWNGAGISAGSNGVTITNNLIWDTDEASLTATKNASNTSGGFIVYNNTFLNGLLINQSALGSANNPVDAIRKNNLILGLGASAQDLLANTNDFLGPISGDASADGYIGSGLQPAAHSTAVGTGEALANVPYDVTGTLRPSSAYTIGAYEMQPASNQSPVYHTVTFSATAGGSLEGYVYQEVLEGDSCDAVTAVAASGYHFESWSGDYDGSENPLGLTNVTQNTAIVANFIPDNSSEPAASDRLAINCAGGPYLSDSGISYKADLYFTAGSTASQANAISATTEDPLYQSERYGTFSYNIPVTNALYTVTLQFAEIYWTSDNQRVFDVVAEGHRVVDDLDIHKKVGDNAAYVVETTVTVDDGILNLDFNASVNYAKISAIVVTPSNGSETPTESETTTPTEPETTTPTEPETTTPTEPETTTPTEPETTTDSDQLPDEWEILYFGGIHAPNGGETEDFDSDGSNNYDEWRAGTDPTNPNDYPGATTKGKGRWKQARKR